MRTRLALLLTATLLVASPHAVFARNIVLTNDDGLTSNLVALYVELKQAGHDVIVSVPCNNQSGMSAALSIARPLTPLTVACLNDAAKPGDPGAGPMTRAGLPAGGDFHYVDGTPVMAMLQGVDVLAKARWGKAPDLVLSGPNEGQNVGPVVLISGTVSNAQVATLRGIPAVALSAGANTEGSDLANPLSKEVARLSLQLVAALDAKAGAGPMLPPGLALNVNFPDTLEGARWQLSRIGTYEFYSIGFTANMAASASPMMQAMAKARGMDVPPLPGVSFDFNTAAPTPEQADDESVVVRKAIAVSPMQGGYEYPMGAAAMSREALQALLPPANSGS